MGWLPLLAIVCVCARVCLRARASTLSCVRVSVSVCVPQVFLLIFGLSQRLIGCLHTLRVVDFYPRLLGGIQRVKITAIKLQICQEWNHESLGRALEGCLLVLGLK